MWGIIAGTGFENFEQVTPLEELNRSTPFGLASTGLKRITVGSCEALFVPRHGMHHELSPSEVNYRANIFALKSAGAKRILCISAIGSLRREIKPGDLVVPSQYHDRTKSLRKATFCTDGVVGHVSLAHPVCPACAGKLRELAQAFTFDSHFDKTYVCIEGPHFSTQADSNYFRTMNADIIGMTGFPEYALAREAGLCYLPCCFVTDYDCWDDNIPHVTVRGLLEQMEKNNLQALNTVRSLLEDPPDAPCNCGDEGLRTGLFTPWERVPPQKKEWLEVLQR